MTGNLFRVVTGVPRKRRGRMRQYNYIVAMVLVGILLASSGRSVEAATPDLNDPATLKVLVQRVQAAGPNAAQEFSKLSLQEQEALKKLYRSVKVEVDVKDNAPARSPVARPSGSVSTQSAGCFTREAIAAGRLIGDIYAYKFFLAIDWCSDGAMITSVSSPRVRGETYYPGYAYLGLTAPVIANYGVGWNQYYTYATGRFTWDFAGVHEDYHPWLQVTGHGDGTSTINGAG